MLNSLVLEFIIDASPTVGVDSPTRIFNSLISSHKFSSTKVGLGGQGHGPVFGTPFDPNLNLVSVSVHLCHGSVRS